MAGPALHEGLCIVDKLFLGRLVTHEIAQVYMGDLRDGHDMNAILVVSHAKSLVKAQLAHAEILIKLTHILLNSSMDSVLPNRRLSSQIRSRMRLLNIFPWSSEPL